MVGYFGDYLAGATVRIPWNTNGADGASITRSGNGTIKVWKDGSTTARSSTSGITDSEDWNSNTGMHVMSLDLSDNADAGFYAAGHDYLAAFVGQTIDGKTVSVFIGAFSIENRNMKANVTQWLSTAPATPTTAGVPIVDLRSFVRVGTAQAGGAAQVTLDSGASATDQLYRGAIVSIISGTGAGQSGRKITDYVGSTKVAKVTPAWATNPASDSVFIIGPGLGDFTLPRGQAFANFQFMMTTTDAAGVSTPATGKTVAVYYCKGSESAFTLIGAPTEVSDGIYKIDLTAAVLSENVVTIKATSAGCDVTLERIFTA